jgi:hypothetical protein
MKKPKIRIVSTASGDWQALYINGKSVHQAHSISIDDFFAVLKANNVSCCLDYDSVEAGRVDSLEAEDCGSLPDSIADYINTRIS